MKVCGATWLRPRVALIAASLLRTPHTCRLHHQPSDPETGCGPSLACDIGRTEARCPQALIAAGATVSVATRDSLLMFETGSRDTECTGVSGANSTAPQGGPGAADAASGFVALKAAQGSRAAPLALRQRS